MKVMTDMDWMGLFVEQSNLVIMLWTVYVLVVSLLVGFVAQRERLDGIRWLLVGTFALFALVSAYSMYIAQDALEKIHGKMSCNAQEIFTVSSTCWVLVFHLILDALVLLFMIFGFRDLRIPTRLESWVRRWKGNK